MIRTRIASLRWRSGATEATDVIAERCRDIGDRFGAETDEHARRVRPVVRPCNPLFRCNTTRTIVRVARA